MRMTRGGAAPEERNRLFVLELLLLGPTENAVKADPAFRIGLGDEVCAG